MSNIQHNLVSKEEQLATSKATSLHPAQTSESSFPNIDHIVESDPAMCNSYLSSPLETIVASLNDYNWDDISCHDITEAYNIFSARIRSIAHTLCSDPSLPALYPLKEHATSLARALRRDIRRALVKPSSALCETPAFYYESYISEISLTDYEIQHTLDISTLCHHSLHVLSAIFTMENLHILFSHQDLDDLLNEVLKIALAIEPPTPNAIKTVSLVFSIIQTQTLPRAVLEPHVSVIVKALRDGLNDQKGACAKRDSLKAIYSLSQRHPKLFTIPLLNFLFPTLTSLTLDDTGCRIQACNALSGMVLAKFQYPNFPHDSISDEIHKYLKPQIPKDSSSSSLREFPLHYFLSRAYQPALASSKEPVWAIITIASLIILSGRLLYARQELAFCVQSFTPALNHKRQDVRQLATAAWGSLVWAFAHLPAGHRHWSRAEDPNIPDTDLGIRGKAFRFLMKPMVDNGKGVLLTRGLLFFQNGCHDGASTAGGVSRALLIVRAMINGSHIADSEDGIEMLCRLLRTVNSVQEPDDVKPSAELFQGGLLEISSQGVMDIARHTSNVEIDRLRALSEAEVTYHWPALLDTWVDAVERTFQLPAPRKNGLLDVWQCLLLVKTDLSQGLHHLTASSSFASQIAGIVTRFIAQPQETSVQVQRLALVKLLWGVMKNVFTTSWLPAERILAGVLKVTFSLEDEHVRNAWSDLCTDLISVGVPTLLHVISTGSEGLEVTRQLWTVLARTWQVLDENAHWEELVSFLVIPFRSWVMSGMELELWEGVLQCSLRMAASDSVEPIVVIGRLFIRLGEKGIDALAAFPKGVLAIMSMIDLSGCTVLPQLLLSVIDRCLVSNYPPRPELLKTCLEVIHLLDRIIRAVPQDLLVDLLCFVEKGVCLWIGDEKEVMLTREHDAVLQELYCSTLQLLRKLPHSLEMLIKISPFLSSAFGRQSSTAIGPLSFNEFWRATYHGIEEYRSKYPDCLKACLLGFSDAYGGSIAEGLSMSQETFSSSIPDSQPLHLDDEEGLFSRVDLEAKQSLSIQPSLSPSPEEDLSSEPPLKRRRMSSPSIKDSTRHVVSQSEPGVDKELSTHPWLSELSSHRPTSPVQEASSDSQFDLSTPRQTPSSKEQASRKRNEVHKSKRRKTEVDLDLDPPDASKSAAPRSHIPPLISPEIPFLSPAVPKGHSNERISPITGMEFSVPPPVDSMSQNTQARKRKRIIEWVGKSRNLQNSAPRGSSSQIASSQPSSPGGRVTRSSTPTSEEYDTWEAGAASMQEIMELRQELVQFDVPETDAEEDEEAGHDSELGNVLGGSQYVIRSNSSGLPGLERHRRSQTVPQHTTTTPLRRARTISSEHFGALEQALKAVTDGGSQMPVDDLIQANEFVAKFQDALNRRLGRLGKSEPSDSG